MKITILSCYQAEKYTASNKSAIIRIGDTKEELDNLKLQHEFDKELRLHFYDIYPSHRIPDNFNEFKKVNYDKLIQFFDEIIGSDIEELVIHCHAGISRSPAIGLMYCFYVRDYELMYKFMSQRVYIPNGFMLKLISEKMELEDNRVMNNLLEEFYHPRE